MLLNVKKENLMMSDYSTSIWLMYFQVGYSKIFFFKLNHSETIIKAISFFGNLIFDMEALVLCLAFLLLKTFHKIEQVFNINTSPFYILDWNINFYGEKFKWWRFTIDSKIFVFFSFLNLMENLLDIFHYVIYF